MPHAIVVVFEVALLLPGLRCERATGGFVDATVAARSLLARPS